MTDQAPKQPTLPIAAPLARTLDVIRAAQLPVLLVGTHGIGKSAFLADYAVQRGLTAYVIDLSLLEATDLTGIPYIADGCTRFAPPAMLPTASSGPSVLILEELNRCDRSVRQPCLQLLTTRRLNDYVLPPDCFLASCVNPDGGGYDVDVLDPALASRFVSLHVVASAPDWLLWARASGVFAPVVAFVERYPQSFDRSPPRSWTMAATLLANAVRQGWAPDQLETVLAGVLKPLAAKALLMELRGELPYIAPAEFVANAKAYQRTIESWRKSGRMDALAATLDALVHYLKHTRPALTAVGRAALRDAVAEAPIDLAKGVREAIDALAK